jgi:AraC-like DNA-binding protein
MAVLFDLDDVVKDERESTLQELMSLLPLPIDVRTKSVETLHVSTVSDYFGSIFLMSCNGRGALVERDAKRVKEDHQRTMLLSVVSHGASRLQQNDAVSDIGKGDVILYSSAAPYRATFDNVGKYTFMIPYEEFQLPDQILHAQLARRLDARDPLALIVSRYLSDIASNAVYLPDEERTALVEPTIGLLRALLTSIAGDEFRSREPLHLSLGTRMTEYLKMHFTDPDLTIAKIAREHGISERYAYLVLAKNGITFADWVRTQRVKGAANELSTIGTSASTIADVAYRWGFPDHANFTRAFHRVYGMSPRDYRAAGQKDAGSVAE